MRPFNLFPPAVLCVFILSSSCKDNTAGCPADSDILTSFVSETGDIALVTNSGEAYLQSDDGCTFLEQYFTPGFEDIYVFTDDEIFVTTDDGSLFPVTNTFYDEVNEYTVLQDAIILSTDDSTLHWNSFVLQSPLAPSVEDYVALRACLLNNTCDFLDNRIDIVSDPENITNKVFQFTAVPPSANMVTSKSSIERTFNYFVKGMNLWYEAKYYIADGMPYSIADFENSYFNESPGPRIVFNGNALAIENKFGDKIKYYQDTPVAFQTGEWVTVKVHFLFSETNNGYIELWQNGIRIMEVTGINLPLFNSIQNSLEVGISATQTGCVLLVDDVRLSPVPF
jgi:hypothetical protein